MAAMDRVIDSLGCFWSTCHGRIRGSLSCSSAKPDGSCGAKSLSRSDITPGGLIIENKIYAADQPAQLDRYRRFAQDSERDPLLLYLTLDGSPPSDNSLHGDETNEDPFNLAPPHISLISYKVFINNWLTACIQSAAELPHLRETLVQYQRLIVSLTHGTLNKEMTMEISDKMLQPDRLRAALEIEKSIPEAKAKLQTKFWECLRGKIDAQMPEIRELKLPNITFSDEGVRSYYLKNRNTPKGYGLTYEVSSLGDDWQAVFAILVESRVYCGFYLLYQGAFREPDNKTIDCTPLHAAVAKVDGEMVGSDFALGGRWWYTDPKLDFASFGEECIRLADGNYLEEIAQRIGKQCVVKIRRFLQ